MSKLPKILLFDIETLPAVAATFSLYPESIHHDNILSDWSIICACWKYLDKPTIYSSSIIDNPKAFKKDVNDDRVVVKKLREVFQDVDIVIGHNSKKFDTKKFNARLIFHGLDPLPSGIVQLDTLTEVRKIAAFTSNRLDYLAKTLTGEGKIETSKGLWLRVLKGDAAAVKEMTTYCKKDVKILEDVYLKLRPYIKNHPHIGILHGEDRECSCPKCGSANLSISKTRFTATGVKKLQKQCNDCHGYSTFTYKNEAA
jgi:DNA polymerase elongation subunit (family B)